MALQTATLYPEQRAIETLAKISNINGTEILPIQIKSYESVPKKLEFGGTLIPTKEIIAIPNKLILMPGQEKVIRILYKGKKIKKEKIFFIETEQAQMKKKRQKKKKFDVQILMNFQKKISVTSQKFLANVKVTAEKTMQNSTPKLTLTFHNHGTKLKRFKQLDLRVRTSKGTLRLTKKDLGINNLIVYPKQVARVTLEWPENIPQTADIISARYYE
ncbi:hypothetical protein OAJ27_01740 [bacterium]|nr:hypothetical protein [bacterium]